MEDDSVLTNSKIIVSEFISKKKRLPSLNFYFSNDFRETIWNGGLFSQLRISVCDGRPV